MQELTKKEIKVGQVWKSPNGNIFTITMKDDEKSYCVLFNNGITPDVDNTWHEQFTQSIVNGKVFLLAEYPTWQEAINSKEFKGNR